MMCNYNIIVDIVIPLLAALIGGLLTMVGVLITIKHENKKSKIEYLEKIRPFFIVDSNHAAKDIKMIGFEDDYEKEKESDQILFRWNNLVVSNMSDSVCTFSYIRINDQVYSTSDEPIKPGEKCEIIGFPFSALMKKTVDCISIGILDKLYNLYEYNMKFRIQDVLKSDKISSVSFDKEIIVEMIECKVNLVKSRQRKP